MQRFYCTICQRVKRVQHLPASVIFPTSTSPRQRIGQCRWHGASSRVIRPRAVRFRFPKKTTVASVPLKKAQRQDRKRHSANV